MPHMHVHRLRTAFIDWSACSCVLSVIMTYYTALSFSIINRTWHAYCVIISHMENISLQVLHSCFEHAHRVVQRFKYNAKR